MRTRVAVSILRVEGLLGVVQLRPLPALARPGAKCRVRYSGLIDSELVGRKVFFNHQVMSHEKKRWLFEEHRPRVIYVLTGEVPMYVIGGHGSRQNLAGGCQKTIRSARQSFSKVNAAPASGL